MHYIRNVVVEQLVLENLREVVSYVKTYEDEFVQMVMDADMKQKSKELAKKKRVLSDKEKRYTQLDSLFQRIYEDNVSGKLLMNDLRNCHRDMKQSKKSCSQKLKHSAWNCHRKNNRMSM